MVKLFPGTRTTVAALLVLVGLAASACATAAPDITPRQITEVDLALRRAEAAGAQRFAPELLGSALEAYDAARRASFARKQDEAQRRIEEAKAWAAAAEIRATAEQRQREAAVMRAQAEALNARLRDLQQRLRTPGQ